MNSLVTVLKEIADSEELHFVEKKHNFRYERKFTVPDEQGISVVEQIILHNSYLFREVFHERQVNNIYFDTPGYSDYFDNVLGVWDRRKIRIRWYGDTFGVIEKPVLEIKIKKGLVGDKWSYKLNPFTLNNDFTSAMIQDIFKQSELPKPILESCKMVSPTLQNSYSRRYYLSADNRFRVTLDFKLIYRRIAGRFNNFNFTPKRDPNKIVELKYALNNDVDANAISTQFPFRLNKNSKYVNGINTIKHFPQ